MAEETKNYISKVKLPDGSEYHIKDREARTQIEELLSGTIIFHCGTSTTVIDDNSTE